MFEVAMQKRGDAFRAIYAVQIGEDVRVLHVFQKTSKSGIAMPKGEMDVVRERLQRLKEALR